MGAGAQFNIGFARRIHVPSQPDKSKGGEKNRETRAGQEAAVGFQPLGRNVEPNLHVLFCPIPKKPILTALKHPAD
jgi:hypothetical protein